MNQTVSFKDSDDKIYPAEIFISRLHEIFQTPLRKVVATLISKGTLNSPRAQKYPNGYWTYVLDSEKNYPTTFTLFLDDEVLALSQVPEPKIEHIDLKKRRREQGILAIQDPNGPRDTIGGQHSGWWEVDQYVTFRSQVDKASGQYLLSIIPELRKAIDTQDYHHDPDGTVHIHIDRIINGVHIRLKCTGEWS